jgi:hypothetical protein
MERARGVQPRGHVDVGRNLQGRARDHNRHTDSKALVITALPRRNSNQSLRFFEPEILRKRQR